MSKRSNSIKAKMSRNRSDKQSTHYSNLTNIKQKLQLLRESKTV